VLLRVAICRALIFGFGGGKGKLGIETHPCSVPSTSCTLCGKEGSDGVS
jgi:hypothetical protein